MFEDGFTIAEAKQNLKNFQLELEKLIPDPSAVRLLELEKEYTPDELRMLLQTFGSYLATLYGLQAKIESESLLISEGFKTGMEVAMVNVELEATTIVAKKAELMVKEPNFRNLRAIEIQNDSFLSLLKGWIKSYESAYTSVSRIITLVVGDIDHQNTKRYT